MLSVLVVVLCRDRIAVLSLSPTLEIALDRLQLARAQEAIVIGAALPAAEFSARGGWGTGSDLARGPCLGCSTPPAASPA